MKKIKSTVLALLVATLLSVFFSPASARAQMTGAPSGYKVEPGITASTVPAALREIGFDQNLDQQLPLDAPFKDESGRDVRLGDFFGSRPVVLALVYFNCPMLCTQVMSGLSSSLGVMSLNPGTDFDVVAVSFDPREKPADAAQKKATFLEHYSRPKDGAGWHFLTGEQPSIDRLTKAAGFRYVWDKDTNQFAHPTGVIVVTPDGRIARYLFGVEYGPRDLRLSLVEASQGKIGSVVDSLLLYCYHYDPMTGRYGIVIMRTLRIAGAATVFGIVTFIVVMVRREKRNPPKLARVPPVGGPRPEPRVVKPEA
jgi:protein SCO1/2